MIPFLRAGRKRVKRGGSVHPELADCGAEAAFAVPPPLRPLAGSAADTPDFGLFQDMNLAPYIHAADLV